MKILETERLYLRPFNLEDTKRVTQVCNDKNVTRYLPFPYPYEEKLAIDWISKMPNEKALDCAIIFKENDLLIGAISLMKKDDYVAELGYWLDPVYKGKGLMTEIAAAVVNYGFENLHYHKIFAKHYAENLASGRVMQKIGMQFVGTLKEHTFKDGKFYDVKLYEILNPKK